MWGMWLSGYIEEQSYRHEKPVNRANLVRRHVCEKICTSCQNSNTYTTNHTFLVQIDHIEGINYKVSKDFLQMYGLFLHPHSHKLAIYSKKSVDSSNQENLFFRLLSCDVCNPTRCLSLWLHILLYDIHFVQYIIIDPMQNGKVWKVWKSRFIKFITKKR